MAHGLIPTNKIPGWPTPPAGVLDACEDALEAAGFARGASNTPDGILVSDVDTALAFFERYAGSVEQLEFNRKAKLANLAATYAAKYDAGFNYTGPDGVKRTFQIDPQSQFNIDVRSNAALGSILAGEDWFTGSYFIAADNTRMYLPTAQDMRKFALAARSYVSSLILTNRAIKDALKGAQTLSVLNAIDPTSLWPTN